MMEITLAILSSFILSVITVALILQVSHKKSWYDKIDDRKIHTGFVPRLGGAGFAPAFILIAALVTLFSRESNFGPRFLPVLLAMLLILAVGIIDDFRSLMPRHKLLIQIVAALLVVIPGYTFRRFFFFDIGWFGELNWIRYPLSLLWIVGLTNALNFIDGVDGLAGGVSALIALGYGIIFSFFADMGSAVTLCICLASVVAGFLVFNLPLPKAKIFMGDGGAYFLGFMLALMPLIEQGDATSCIPLPYAAALALIPILDTVAAIWRRLRDGRRIDSPDRLHLHHKLLNLGLRSWGVNGLLYGLQILLIILVILSIKIPGPGSLFILGGGYVIAAGFFSAVHFMNRAALRRLPSRDDDFSSAVSS
jgi:UDP-GlcNAc:undecaprenyl-phosphate GlcNAc-1-phosphate transferase